jgi:hypothetical protein
VLIPPQAAPFNTNTGASLQGSTAIGGYASWSMAVEPGCASGYRYLYQQYTGGTYASGCSTTTTPSQYRNMRLYYQCGPAGSAPSLAYVQESPACNVSAAMSGGRLVILGLPVLLTDTVHTRVSSHRRQYELILTVDCSTNPAGNGTLCQPAVSRVALRRLRWSNTACSKHQNSAAHLCHLP